MVVAEGQERFAAERSDDSLDGGEEDHRRRAAKREQEAAPAQRLPDA